MPTYRNPNRTIIYNGVTFPKDEPVPVPFHVASEFEFIEVDPLPDPRSVVLFADEVTDDNFDVLYSEFITVSAVGGTSISFAGSDPVSLSAGNYTVSGRYAYLMPITVVGTVNVVVEGVGL